MTHQIFNFILASLVISFFLGVMPVSAQRNDFTKPTPTVTATKTKTPTAAQRATATAIASKNATATAIASAAAAAKAERDRNRDELKKAANDSRKAATDTDKVKSLAELKRLGNKAGGFRISAIDEFVAGMNKGICSKATAATLNTIRANMATLKTTLTNILTALAAEKNIEAAKADVKSIFDSGIYTVEFPASRGMCSTSYLQSTVMGKLNSAVALLNKLGANTTAIVAKINEVNASLTKAKSGFETAAKTPSGSNAKTSLKTAIVELGTAREGIHVIRDRIEEAKKEFKTPTPGVTASPTSTRNTDD